MVELSGRSAGVSIREIDLTGPRKAAPAGVPAGVIGTADKGPAFVPLTFATTSDFVALFGNTDGSKFGPLAVAEWLRNAQAATFLRVLGVGDGQKRTSSGANAGNVTRAGFVVGQQLPLDTGFLGSNAYANENGVPGRIHFLGCYMSESAGSTVFSSAGIQTGPSAVPILRGVIMAPSGVTLMLSTSFGDSTAPAAGTIATSAGPRGAITGTVNLAAGAQDFVVLLNGHKGTDSSNPNVITASFDQTSPKYFGSIFNTDPFAIQEKGHYLYTRYDVHPVQAVVTGSGIILPSLVNQQCIAILTTGSAARNVGSTTVPSYENFEERFTTPASPTIISQKFGGNYLDLFRIYALSDGAESNTRFKISIENIAKSTVNDQSYGTFDLVVRDFADTDDNQRVLDSYRGLTLDPQSDNYIARRIGDTYAYYDFDKNQGGQKIVVTGRYPNISNLIRVEMDAAVEDGEIDASALPIGFRGPRHLVTSGSNPLTSIVSDAGTLQVGNTIKRMVEPPIPFRENINIGINPKREANQQLYWGVQFEQKISLVELNASRSPNQTIANMTKFFPQHQISNQNVWVGENHGVADTAGIVLDSDRFNNNLFALDRILVRTGSDGLIDAKQIVSMSYVRNGMISTDDVAKTRAYSVQLDFGSSIAKRLNKFSFFIQGGFDGVNPFNRDTAALSNAAVQQEMDDPNRGQDQGPTVRSYKTALSIMGNTTDVDIKLLAIPGIRHPVVTDTAITTVESDRFDALYIMDIEEYDTLNSVVTSSLQDINVSNTKTNFSLRGLDSNFAASYFPDVVMTNPFNNLPVSVPPSVVILGAFALNDAIAHPWFAPAGYTRGALQSTESAVVKLSRNNMDVLQDAHINPIVSFPGSKGVVVWGQKTLQAAQSALDRVNVRRLLIEIRRQVRTVANSLLFEPNRETTLARFSSLVTPLLVRIQEQQGVNRFKVKIDTTTTTQADVENNTIRGKIYVEPTRTTEVVSIDFVLTNLGAEVQT
jgi:phage tail sheath protein FI